MTTIYEGMYLLDNEAVRQDWNAAKSIITSTLEKHGATVHTARRWDERRLAYPIKKRNRATFLLSYFEIPGENIPAMRRDFELNETVLRSLEIAVDAIPETETDLAAAEQSKDFIVPTPPDDDAIDEVEVIDDDDDMLDDDEDGPRRPRTRRVVRPVEVPKAADDSDDDSDDSADDSNKVGASASEED
jgi:small subunit ribosomal protein S6